MKNMILMLFAVEIFATVLERIFCENLLTKREGNRRHLDFAVWSAYFVVFNGTSYLLTDKLGIAWLNLFLFVFTFFVTIRILYADSVRTLITATVFLYLSGMCSELLIFYGRQWWLQGYDEDETLLCTVLSKLVWFIIIKLSSLIVKVNRRVELNTQDWLEVFIVPVSSIWILLAIFITGTLKSYFWGFAAVALVLVINVFTYYLYDKAKQKMEERFREESLQKQCDYYVRQSRESTEWWEKFRELRHNMKQHFILENAFLEQQNYDALKKYCNENLLFLNRQKCASDSGNIYIDSVINYKADAAEKEGIQLATDVRVPADAELDAGDICILLGNLLDNAIEAVRELTEDKVIHARIIADGSNLTLNVINPYRNELCKKGTRYLTTKEDKSMHGLGLAIVRQIAEKYHGEVAIQDRDNVFDAVVLLYGFLKQTEK